MSEPVSTREAAGSVPVSTQCPNCGSDGRRLEDRRVPYLCGVVSWVDADKKVIVSKETEACSLIRSLRNERDTLAAAINATSIPTRRECPGPCGDSDVCGCYWTGYRFAQDHFEPVETKEAFEAGFEQGRDAERDRCAEWHDARAEHYVLLEHLARWHSECAGALRNNEHRSKTQ